jgi:hypothetical protein
MTPLRQRLADRLAVLEREAAIGEERLHALEEKATALRHTLLRITGATQVLREVLDDSANPDGADGAATPAVRLDRTPSASAR